MKRIKKEGFTLGLIILVSLFLVSTGLAFIEINQTSPQTQKHTTLNDFVHLNFTIKIENLTTLTFNWNDYKKELKIPYRLNIKEKYSLTDYSDKNLFLAYNFDNILEENENSTFIKDFSLYKNHGFLYNKAQTSDEEKKFNKVLKLEGNEDYLAHETFSQISVEKNYSFSIWIFVNDDYESDQNAVFQNVLSNSDKTILTVEDETILFSVYDGIEPMGVSGEYNTQEWTNIIGIKEGKSIKLYINSMLQNNTALVNQQNAPGFMLGKTTNAGFDHTFDGYIDEFRVWNKTLTQNDINEIYSGYTKKLKIEDNDEIWELNINKTTLDSKTYNYSIQSSNKLNESSQINGSVKVFDTTALHIKINSPKQRQPSQKLRFLINISTSKNSTIKYSLDNKNNKTLCTNCRETTKWIEYPSITAFKAYALKVWVQDEINQTNQTTINFSLLKDSDNNGVPDEDETNGDLDNDGINDSQDTLKGNETNLNTNFAKPKIFINQSNNFSILREGFVKVNVTNESLKQVVNFYCNLNASKGDTLDLSELVIYKQEPTDSKANLLIKGIPKACQTKAKEIYLDIVDTTKSWICYKDEDNITLDTIDELDSGCEENGGILLSCDGKIHDGKTCTKLNTQYKIEGLTHSVVLETNTPPITENPRSGGSSSGGGSSLITVEENSTKNSSNMNQTINPEKEKIIDTEKKSTNLLTGNAINDDLESKEEAVQSSKLNIIWLFIFVLALIITPIIVTIIKERKNIQKRHDKILKKAKQTTQIFTLIFILALLITTATATLMNFPLNNEIIPSPAILNVTISSSLITQSISFFSNLNPLSAGVYHTCALQENGTALCWGKNNYNQSSSINAIFTEISTGLDFTCALQENGTALCWGKNNYNQSSPPNTLFSQISSGAYHTCALQENGTALCWGKNNYNQASPPNTLFSQISSGAYNTCALQENGTALCWGKNNYNQASPPNTTFLEISPGKFHTCAITTDYKPLCWGRNNFNQSSSTNKTITQISSGATHTCALTTNNSLTCWGDSKFFPAEDINSLKTISVKDYSTCAIKDNGTIICWGKNHFGQLNTTNFQEITFETKTGLLYTKENVENNTLVTFEWQNLTDKTYLWSIKTQETLSLPKRFTIDTQNPSLKINSPEETTYNKNQIVLSISADDKHLDKIIYSYNETNFSYENPSNITLSDSKYNLTVWAIDKAGNTNTSQISFEVDTRIMNITIVAPNKMYNSDKTTLLNISVTGTQPEKIYYTYSKQNETNNTLSLYDKEINLSLNDSTYNLLVIANKTGISNSTNFTFVIDTISPSTNIISPVRDSFVSSIDLEINVTEMNFKNLTVILTNDSGWFQRTIESNFSHTIYYYQNLVESTYYLMATSFDLANNMNHTEMIQVTLGDQYEGDNTPEEATPIIPDGTEYFHTFLNSNLEEDVDWATFHIPKGHYFTIETKNYSDIDKTDTEIYLYENNASSWMQYNDDIIGGRKRTSKIIWYANEDKEFHVKTKELYGSSHSNYSLTVETQGQLIPSIQIENTNINPNQEFIVTGSVTCTGGTCHNVTFALDPIPEDNKTKNQTDKDNAKVFDDEEINKELEAKGKVEVIVKYTDTKKKSLKLFWTKKETFKSFKGDTLSLTKEELEELSKSDSVEAIFLDKEMTISLDDSVPRINAPSVWNDLGIEGSGVSVCVIDTGIDYNHPNLRHAYRGGYDIVNNDPDPMDDHGHGTHIAGIIASNHDIYRGVAPKAGIVAVKSLSYSGAGSTSQIISGIEWCTEHKDEFNITVISLSLGDNTFGPNLPCDYVPETYAINAAVERGITVIAASGNEARGYSSFPGITDPACISNVISVGSSGSSTDAVQSHTNRDWFLDLLNPGYAIYSTRIGSGFATKTGTSMATPHIAGIIALMQENAKKNFNYLLSPSEIKQKLKLNGVKVQDSTTPFSFTRTDAFLSVENKGIIPMNPNAKPFYTLNTNPLNCQDLEDGETCEGIWTVNATGNPGNYTFFTIAQSLYDLNSSEKINVEIKPFEILNLEPTNSSNETALNNQS